MVSDPDGGHVGRMKERRVFLFEQLVIFSEPLEKKRGFSLPGFLYKNSIKVSKRAQNRRCDGGLKVSSSPWWTKWSTCRVPLEHKLHFNHIENGFFH